MTFEIPGNREMTFEIPGNREMSFPIPGNREMTFSSQVTQFWFKLCRVRPSLVLLVAPI